MKQNNIDKQELYKFLANAIRGDISIHVIENTLIVDISAYGIPWRYTTEDLSNDHDFDIVSEYNQFIYNLFFAY